MKILVIFTLCLISDGGAFNEVTGYSGGGVLIKCKYETKYTQNSKYFCKGSRTSCSDQIKTETKNQWVNSGRFSLFDDTRSSEFWVMIRELTVQDTGMYQCGVDLPWDTDICTPVVLNVIKDQFYEKSIRETVHVGGDLTLRFKYPDSLKSNPKFVCRMKTPDSACFYKDSVNESRKSIKMGKFVLYDDRAKQHFNVSISNVTEQNSGEYWCGAEVNWTSDHGYKVYFTDIKLRVTDELQLTPTSPPAGFPAYTAITVSVILLLLLIGILILSVTFQRRCRMRDPKTTRQAPKEMNEDYETDLNVFPGDP